ncbi:MAG: hypothetical protein V2I97_04780 [Desulfococcaceae bacterium]|jgi:hypothetical protein|nr:hypothetical protein [Desulfococcaceae bacterium]
MTHHHDHEHSHEHHHGSGAELSFAEKMCKLIEHWLKHNEDHADNYREWAEKARKEQMTDLGKILEEIAVMTVEMNRKFEAAASLVKDKCK